MGGIWGAVTTGTVKGALAGAAGGAMAGGLVANGCPPALAAVAGSVAQQLVNGDNPLETQNLIKTGLAAAGGWAFGRLLARLDIEEGSILIPILFGAGEGGAVNAAQTFVDAVFAGYNAAVIQIAKWQAGINNQ